MSQERTPIHRKFLSIQELSELSGLSVSQLRRLVRAGKLPYHQPAGKGGKLLFPQDAIEQAGEFGSGQPEPLAPKALPGRPPNWTKTQY